ncbi:DUF4139 domain-containing protein [Pelagibius sp.]|uniref:DUF4139 domain-containing protein n=1 Tax=Pelagibius sp. TaxID=1931238 RepID=UPI003BAFDF57
MALTAPATAGAAETKLTAENRSALALTVYSNDLAMISEERRASLPAGEALLAIEDVSDRLRAETVLLGGAGVTLLEQSFVVDLLTPQRLLESALGKTVSLIRTHPQTGEDRVVEAEVLSLAGGVVLRVDGRIETTTPGRIAFAEIPAGLRSEPALLARLAVAEAGEKSLRLDYLTSGLSWRADYVARLNAAEDRMDLSALVTLTNATRSDYRDAALRLVAGDVNQTNAVPLSQPKFRNEMVAMSAPADAIAPPQSASDRYVYPVNRPVTLLRGETKQVPLMSAEGVAVKREYRFDGLANGNARSGEIGPVSADLVLEIENAEALGLGAPLPAGVVRIYGPGPGNAPLFLGEDFLAQTPEGEKARLRMGSAFDVTARARSTEFERLSNRSYETAQAITVKNAKDQPVEVLVGGSMPQGWTMLEETQPHEEETVNRIVWRLQVPAGGETELRYRVRVSN